MAFTVPDFNLTCDIYTGPFLTKVLRLSTVCNLQHGRRSRVFGVFEQPNQQTGNGPMFLLLPAGTDVRDLSQGIVDNDIAEVPQGSGRWYSIWLVDDVAKGFDNEFRCAEIYKASSVFSTAYGTMVWPIPMP